MVWDNDYCTPSEEKLDYIKEHIDELDDKTVNKIYKKIKKENKSDKKHGGLFIDSNV